MAKVKVLKFKKSRFLFLGGDLWMWDTLRERELQENLAKQAFGDVLVAGYGFGLVSKFLFNNPKVKSVTTVEKYKEVIDRMKKNGKVYGAIIIDDFYTLPKSTKFDCIVGDIWPDIDEIYLSDYLKFKKKSLSLLKPKGQILAWGKDYFEFLFKKKRKSK